MDSKQIFEIWLRVKAESAGRPWRKPKNWDKIMARPDWPIFERLEAEARSTMSLVDVEDFFRSNLEARGGRFTPHQFFQKNSFMFYNRWKKLPKKAPELNQVASSLKFIINFCKTQGITVSDYFRVDTPYPNILRHYQSGKLHRWIFGYYAYKVNPIVFKEMPVDIIEHAMGEESEDKVNIWWMQLLNDEKTASLVANFFERIVNDSS